MSLEGVTINELSKMANVTVRTIRFYSDEGVLDSPSGRDRYARYTRRHYLQLHVAKTLKEQFYPLRVIREKIAKMSDQELEYMAGPIPAEIEARFSDATMDVVLEERSDMVYAHHEKAHYADMLFNEGAPAVANHRLMLPLTRQNTTKRDVVVMSAPPPENYISMPSKPTAPLGEVWHRLAVKPGIELHVSEDAMQDSLGEIKRIIASLRKR